MQTNLNTINFSENYNEDVKNYIYAALNLGQRLGVQDNNITLNSFKFSDFFTLNENDIEKYCIKILYNPLEEILEFIPYNISENLYGDSIKISIKENQKVTEKIELEEIINNIKFYNDGFINYNTEEEKFIFAFDCYRDNTTLINDYLSNDNYIQYLLEEYDHENNELLSSIKISKNIFVKRENNNFNNLLTISYLYKENESYKLKFYQIVENEFFNDIIYDIKNKLTNDINLNSLLNNYIEQGRIKVIKNNGNNTLINLNYDNERNSYWSLDDENITFNIDSEEIYLWDNINSILYTYTQDVNYLYIYLKKYYSKNIYYFDNKTLKLKIIANVIKEITNNIGKSENNEYLEFYAPLNYEIKYFCKNDDLLHIYESSDNIYFELIDSDITKDNLKYITYRSNENKISLYTFKCEYDTINDEELVNSINVKFNYTLPYIDKDNYWWINDKKTDIYAKGKNAGQPNLIYIYNDSKTVEDRKEIISTLLYSANKEKLFYIDDYYNEFDNNILNNSEDNIHWKKEEITIKGLINSDNSENESDINYNNTFYKLETNVIDFSKYNKEIQNELLNSMIINITSINNQTAKSTELIEDLNKIYGENGFITTFWFLQENENNEYEYTCLKDPLNTNFSLDINELSSVNNLILWHLKKYKSISPDNFIHNQIIFDCSYITTKNQTEDDIDVLNKKIYASIRGIETTHLYNGEITASSKNSLQDNYNNASTVVLDFVDNVVYDELDERIVTGVSKEGRWFSYTNKNLITNYKNTYDFIPNTIIPTLELKEILLRNTNTINRNNIIIIDEKDPYYYYSYVGSPYNKQDKKTFVIGTGTYNKSFGIDNMSDRNDFFERQTSIEINFKDTTYLNSTYSYTNNIVNKTYINTPYIVSNKAELKEINNNTLKSENINVKTLETNTSISKEEYSYNYILKDKDSSIKYVFGDNYYIIEGYLTEDSDYIETIENEYCYYYKFDIQNYILNNLLLNLSLDKILLNYCRLKTKIFKPIKFQILVKDNEVLFDEISTHKKWNFLSREQINTNNNL